MFEINNNPCDVMSRYYPFVVYKVYLGGLFWKTLDCFETIEEAEQYIASYITRDIPRYYDSNGNRVK